MVSPGNGKTESPYNGSPLDLLPCPPSRLLFTYDYSSVSDKSREYVRNELERTEICIKRRSLAIENKWCTDRLKQTHNSIMQTKILRLLDILDKHCYVISDINDSLDNLYKQIFAPIDLVKNDGASKQSATKKTNGEGEAAAAAGSKSDSCGQSSTSSDSSEQDGSGGKKRQTSAIYSRSLLSDDELELNKPMGDKDVVHLLCDWATTTKRYGLHRIFYAVFLIKKRQLDWIEHLKEADNFLAQKMRSKKRKSASMRSASTDKAKLAREGNMASIEVLEPGTRKRKLKSESLCEEMAETGLLDEAGKAKGANKKIKLDAEAVQDDSEAGALKSSPNKQGAKPSSSLNRKKLNTSFLDEEADLSGSESNSSDESGVEEEEDKKSQVYEYLFQKVLFEYLENKAVVLGKLPHYFSPSIGHFTACIGHLSSLSFTHLDLAR